VRETLRTLDASDLERIAGGGILAGACTNPNSITQ
jgi:hypothetical protein